MAKAIIAKRKTGKPTKAAKQGTGAALDRYDPRVKALAQDLLRDVFEKEDLRLAAERQQREQAEKEASEKRATAAEAQAKAKRKKLPVDRWDCEVTAADMIERDRQARADAMVRAGIQMMQPPPA